MSLKDKLEIFLITFNRKAELENTLKELFAQSSPVRELDITILNNHSIDGTTELVDEYCKKYPNLKQIVNPINIGANANYLRAYELAQKPYLWVLCDNDTYDWGSFSEVEKAIDEDYPVIIATNLLYNSQNKWYVFMNGFSFIPSAIIKVDEIDPTTIINAYHNIPNQFPQLAIAAKFVNEDKPFYSVSKTIVKWVANKDSTIRTLNKTTVSPHISDWFFLWGFVRSCELIHDPQKRASVLRQYSPSKLNVFSSYVNEIATAKWKGNLHFKQLLDVLWILPIDYKFLFLIAILYVHIRLVFVKKMFCFLRDKSAWIEYLQSVNQQTKINKLVRRYRGKKVLFYGAGLLFDVLNECCDLSGFNVCAISDNKFDKEQVFKGYYAIPVDKISDLEPDVIILCVAEPKLILPHLEHLKYPKIHILKKCTLNTFFVP